MTGKIIFFVAQHHRWKQHSSSSQAFTVCLRHCHHLLRPSRKHLWGQVVAPVVTTTLIGQLACLPCEHVRLIAWSISSIACVYLYPAIEHRTGLSWSQIYWDHVTYFALSHQQRTTWCHLFRPLVTYTCFHSAPWNESHLSCGSAPTYLTCCRIWKTLRLFLSYEVLMVVCL